jgi:hypothetical protein
MALRIPLPDPDPLKDPLQSLSRRSLSQPCKIAILKEFWGAPNSSVDWSKVPFDTYFEDFEEQCRLSLHNWDRHDISILNFSHVVMVASMIKEAKTRADIEVQLRSAMNGVCEVLYSEMIDLTVRLVLMIQIGGYRNVLMPGQETMAWTDGPLSDSLNAHFTRDNVLKESVDLDKSFTARSLERIAGIRIVWTSNLLDVRKIGSSTPLLPPPGCSVSCFSFSPGVFPDSEPPSLCSLDNLV